MLYYALIFFIVAIIAGALGFGGIASATAGTACGPPADYRNYG